MTELEKAQRVLNLNEIVGPTRRGLSWTLGEINWDLITKSNDAYFDEGDVEIIIVTTKPKRKLDEIIIFLNDHEVIFDRIERQPKPKVNN